MIRLQRLLAFVVLLFTLQSCAQPKALVYQDIQNLRVHEADAKQVVVRADLSFYNPNGYALSMKQGNIQVYFNNNLLGNAVLDTRVQLPAKATVLMPISLTAGLQSLLVGALELLGNPEVTVRLEGNIKAGKGRVFVNMPVRYEGRQRIEL